MRQSAFAYLPLGPYLVPLPLLGALAFSVFLGVTLLPEERRRYRFGFPLALALGVSSIALFLIQAFLLRQFCWLCVIVDLCGAACLVVVLEGRERAFHEKRALLEPFSWGILGALGLLAPLLYPRVVAPSALPHSIAELYQPDKVNVVEFFDYQCPHCQELIPRVRALFEAPDVVVRRGYVPLAQHQAAREIARVAICLEGIEGGRHLEAFEAPLWSARRVDPGSLSDHAVGLGVERAVLQACLDSGRPEERLRDDRRRLEEAEFLGLPTTYIGEERLLGARPTEEYRVALERARKNSGGKLGAREYALAVFLLGGIVVWFGRVRSSKS